MKNYIIKFINDDLLHCAIETRGSHIERISDSYIKIDGVPFHYVNGKIVVEELVSVSIG